MKMQERLVKKKNENERLKETIEERQTYLKEKEEETNDMKETLNIM